MTLLRLVLLGSVAFVAREQDAVTLRFHPPVGTTVSYVTTNTMTQTVPGLIEPIVSTTSTPVTLSVVGSENGVTTVESKSGRTTVTLPPNSPLASMKARLEQMSVGLKSTFSIDERGNLKASKIAATGPDADFAHKIGNGVVAGLQGVVLPEGAVKVGDTWTLSYDLGQTLTTALGGGAKAVGKIPIVFRLTSLEGGIAKISFTMKGSAVAGEGKSKMLFMMRMTGDSALDTATGLVRSSASTGDNDMTAMGQTMHQHIVTAMKAL